MSNGPSEPPPKKPSPRRKVIYVLSVSVFVLLAIIVSQTSFDLPFLNPDSNQQIAFFAGLSALIFLLFVALTFVLVRNLVKLSAERQSGVLGSKFRTRLVAINLLLSFLPVIIMFWFAYGLMNRSIDKWFSRPVEEVRQDTAAMASLLSTYAGQNAQSEAQSMAQDDATQNAFTTQDFSALAGEFRRHEVTLQSGFAVALWKGNAAATFNAPAAWPDIQATLPKNWRSAPVPRISLEGTEYILGIAPVKTGGSIVVAMPLPPKFAETATELQASQRRYFALAAQRRLVRRTYMGLLLLLTVLVLFSATWLALFLSKLVTRPVVALAEATQEISRGRLDYRVEIQAADEIGDLVQSFNRMAADLQSGRRELQAANEALEQRRRHIETILESIPTGVLSLDAHRRITHANHALMRLFHPLGGEPGTAQVLIGAPMKEAFPPEVLEDLEPLLRRADRMGATTTQLEMTVQRSQLNVALTVATLEHEGTRHGYVLVFEDLSDLLKAQKQTAWREVARRVAHEIKNPLTPIALSAGRILRHLEKEAAPDAASLGIIRNCAETISGSVETVRGLVDEFATLARFPAANPQPSNLNAVVQSTLAMFEGRLAGIHLSASLGEYLPKVMADPEAIKRVLANLVDNAAEAVQDSMLREIAVTTSLAPDGQMVELIVADTGHGVTKEVKERLFLPYFSTKKRGTGLGLAIVSRIVEDHRGAIRVEENKPVGARFIVELPLAAEPGVMTANTQYA